jgi:hypothetical protein
VSKLAPVKWKWWTVVAGLALLAVLALGLERSRRQQRGREELQVAAAFTGDAAAFEALRGGRERTVAMMEGFIQRHQRADLARIEHDIASLASPEVEARLLARVRLTLLPEPAVSLLKTHCDRLASGSVKDGLRHLIAERGRLQKQIAGFLAGLYAENFHRLFVARRDRFQRDCQDQPARLFFAYAPFEQVWNMLKDSSSDLQLRFLLWRLYTGRDDRALPHLERFDAADILRVAGQTWWPVQIESWPKEDGAGSVTMAATLEGNRATHLLRLTWRAASSPGGRTEWVSCDRWSRWTYVFRYKEPQAGREGVVYVENEVHRPRPGGRSDSSLGRERLEEKLWLPEAEAIPLNGLGRCEIVRRVPAALQVPLAAVSRQEAARWQAGSVFEWARPLFTSSMQDHLRFEPNEDTPPALFASPEEAAHDKSRKRVRKRT